MSAAPLASESAAVSRFEASLFPVNAYLVDTGDGVVAVDATLGESDGRALRARVAASGKPLVAVLVTHSHPDHYGGLAPLVGHDDIPIYAVHGVDATIRRDDDAKDRILRPMFGGEWPARRLFPTRTVSSGETLTIGRATFTPIDLGAGESPHDSIWRLALDGRTHAFVGDLVYGHMHAYLADGFYEEWVANLERAKAELPADATLFVGHGAPAAGHAILDWQRRYIERFVDAVRDGAMSQTLDGDALVDAVVQRMKTFLPSDDLLFLARLSVPPMRSRLAGA